MSWNRSAQQAAIATLDGSEAAVLHEWFPCTQLLAGDGLAVAVERFRSQQPSADERPDVRAARWAACLAAAIAADPAVEGYAADVATYEGIVAELALGEAAADDALLAAARNACTPADDETGAGGLVPVGGRHVRMAHFQFDAPSIVAAIEACDRLAEHEQPAPRIALFVRQPREERPDVMFVSAGIELLLALCDGTRDAAGIVEELRQVADGDDRSDLAARTFAALAALRARNVISDGRAHYRGTSQ